MTLTTHKFPVLDTGIGREAGYASDAELIEAAQAERDRLTAWERALADRLDVALDRRFLFGEG